MSLHGTGLRARFTASVFTVLHDGDGDRLHVGNTSGDRRNTAPGNGNGERDNGHKHNLNSSSTHGHSTGTGTETRTGTRTGSMKKGTGSSCGHCIEHLVGSWDRQQHKHGTALHAGEVRRRRRNRGPGRR